MPIVKYKNQSGVTYAYEQTSSYDAEKKQSRPVRKYLGRVDPETGEIIKTTGKRGRPSKKASGNSPEATEPDYRKLYEQKCLEIDALGDEIAKERSRNGHLSGQVRNLKQVIKNICDQAASIKDL